MGEKVKFLSFTKIVQMSAEHQVPLECYAECSSILCKDNVFFVPFFFSELCSFLSSLAKKGTERRQR
jgi:hypothetical protein